MKNKTQGTWNLELVYYEHKFFSEFNIVNNPKIEVILIFNATVDKFLW